MRKLGKKIILSLLGAFILAGLICGPSNTLGWKRNKMGSFQIVGPKSPSLVRHTGSCEFDVCINEKGEQKLIVIYLDAIEKRFAGSDDFKFEIWLDLDEWQELMDRISQIDERVRRYWRTGVLED